METVHCILSALLSAAALFAITKLMGHKQVAQLDFFDYVCGITIGSIGAELATEFEKPHRPLIALAVYGVLSLLLNLLAHKGGSFCITVQLPQNLSVGGVDDQGPNLTDTGNGLFNEGQNIFVFLAALQGDHAVPKALNGQNGFNTIVNIFSAQVFGTPALAQTFVTVQPGKLIFCHYCSSLPSVLLHQWWYTFTISSTATKSVKMA